MYQISSTSAKKYDDSKNSNVKIRTETSLTPHSLPFPFQEISEKPAEETKAQIKRGPTYGDLSQIYKLDFENIPFGSNVPCFFALREQIIKIEKFASTHLKLDMKLVRQKIKDILKTHDYEVKMGELGMILFYLNRDKTLPKADSLIAYRAHQIETQIKKYLSAHAEIGSDPLVPSGKTHYLMRAFAHMLLAPRHVYNLGGLIALQQLLLNPAYSLSQYLEPEHREHVLVVIANMRLNPAFETLFQKRVAVHPDLQDVIRIDLKLPPTVRVSSMSTYYACLIAFFSDVRQGDEPNCYAVSSLIYATENYTYKTLLTLLQWLKQGQCSINQTAILLKPLLEKRMTCKEDFEIVLESKKAAQLFPLRQISKLLSLRQESLQDEIVPLSNTLSMMLESDNASNHLPYAEKLYYAFKYSLLNQLQIAIIEVCAANISISTPPYSKDKHKLLDMCRKGLIKASSEEIPSQFLDLFIKKIGETLWLENCNEKNVVDNVGRIITSDTQTIHGFKGKLHTLSYVLSESVRVFSIKEGKYFPLLTISELQKTLIEVAENVIQDYSIDMVKSKFTQVINSKSFRITISNGAASQIKMKGICGKHLNWADLLIFHQKGAYGKVALASLYEIGSSTLEIEGTHTPYQFLIRLQNELKEKNLLNFLKAPKIHIVSARHEWTLSPVCYKLLIESVENFYPFIQLTVFDRAKKILSFPIPENVVDRIIERYTDNELERKNLKECMQLQKRPSYCGCRDLLLIKSVFNKKYLMKRLIEEEFSKITLTEKELCEIYRLLNIKIDPLKFEKLFNKMPKLPLLPYQLALHLRTALLEENLAILNPHLLEHAVCDAKGLPLTIPLGDLNYRDDCREDPSHRHLGIAFSWVSGIPLYFEISKSLYRAVDSIMKYNHFLLQFPIG